MITFKDFYREQNVAGSGGALGTWNSVGGQFPGSGDTGYNPDDLRQLSPYGPAGAVLGAKIKGKKKKKIKSKIYRRSLPGM